MGQRLSVEELLPGENGMCGLEMPQSAEICLSGWWVPTGVQMAERNSGEQRKQKQHSEIWVFPQVPLAAK